MSRERVLVMGQVGQGLSTCSPAPGPSVPHVGGTVLSMPVPQPWGTSAVEVPGVGTAGCLLLGQAQALSSCSMAVPFLPQGHLHWGTLPEFLGALFL